MLKKPFALTLLCILLGTLIGFVINLLFAMFGAKNFSSNAILSSYFGAMYAGVIYTRKYKEEIEKSIKIKTTLYYFLIQLIILAGILYFLKTTLNDPAVITMGLIFTIAGSALIYAALGSGCKLQIKEFEKKN